MSQVIKGFAVSGKDDWNKPKLLEYELKTVLPQDIVVKIECGGVCGSDIHTIKESWGPLNRKDLVVGHEIVGEVVQVGPEVKDIKIGQRVGTGPQIATCGECKYCKNDMEPYCKNFVLTYNFPDANSGNYVTQGGFASHAIAKESHVFPIPDSIPSKYAAPLMCAGLTVYSPLNKYLKGDGKGKSVAIIGIGGLGHLGIQFAKALGAKVTAFSRSSAKKEECLKLGADDFVATGEDKEWVSRFGREFDLVLNCASSMTQVNVNDFITATEVGGSIVNVGVPSMGELLQLHTFSLCLSNAHITGSAIGSKKEAVAMLDLVAKNKIYPMIETVPISEESLGTVFERTDKSDVRYRFVMTDFDKAFN